MTQIIRIDTHNTHGWQARWPTGQPRKYGSKLFSDSRHGGPDAARAAAKQFLADHPELAQLAPRAVPAYRPKPIATNTSGIPGVHRTHSYHGQTGEKQEFWVASVTRNGKLYLRKFYIGKRSEEEAKQSAVEFRQGWERAVDAGKEAEFWGRQGLGWKGPQC